MTSDISVIIPVYNVEKYLKRCVDSVRCQTLKNIEIILVDDGSPDKSPMLCDEYAAEDARIRVIHKKNGGLSSARNAGMKIASGKYIFFLDSDDWIDVDGLELLFNTAERHQVDFVRYRPFRNNWPGLPENTPVIFERSRQIPSGYYDKELMIRLVYHKMLITSDLMMGPIVGAWSFLCRRDFLTQNDLFFDENILFSEDLLFSAQVIVAANNFYYIEHACVYHYFYNPDSISKSFRAKRWDACKKIISGSQNLFAQYEAFDFAPQVMRLKWFCVFLALGEMKYLKTRMEKLTYCKTILDDTVIKGLSMTSGNLKVSFKQYVKMWLVKLRQANILIKFY